MQAEPSSTGGIQPAPPQQTSHGDAPERQPIGQSPGKPEVGNERAEPAPPLSRKEALRINLVKALEILTYATASADIHFSIKPEALEVWVRVPATSANGTAHDRWAMVDAVRTKPLEALLQLGVKYEQAKAKG